MDAQLKKGLLDVLVLAIIKKGDTYGYGLLQETLPVMDVSESALYPVLRRLESQGCLRTYRSEHNGRLRKYYSITDAGIIRLEEYRGQCRDLKAVIDYILG